MLGLALLTGSIHVQAAAPPPVVGAEPIAASWKRHSYSFQFIGYTSTYSCDGLADKLKELLLAAGARKDVKSVPHCSSNWGTPDKLASAELTFYSLEPQADAGASVVKSAIGAWRSVQFTVRSPTDLERGDCELVAQFRQHLLPLFTTRNQVDTTNCVTHDVLGSHVDLRFETLAAAPISDAARRP